MKGIDPVILEDLHVVVPVLGNRSQVEFWREETEIDPLAYRGDWASAYLGTASIALLSASGSRP